MRFYRLERKKRRTVCFKFEGDGSLIVSAPYFLPEKEIPIILQRNEKMIARLEKNFFTQKALLQNYYPFKNIIPLMGKNYHLVFCDKPCFILQESSIAIGEKTAITDLKLGFRRLAKDILTKKITNLSLKLQAKAGKIKINSARGKYGSCSYLSDINFSFRLLFYDENEIDYVVVHELCHIKQKDHSKIFWKEVERNFANYKEAKKSLNEKAYLMNLL